MKKVSSKKILRDRISSNGSVRTASSNTIKRTRRISKRGGFTLTEMIIVVVVVAIISAVALPSMLGFIRHGQQVNRMNIARTLYLSMQNQLSRGMVEGNLGSILTDGINPSNVQNGVLQNTNNRVGLVSARLGVNFPTSTDGSNLPGDEGNEQRVFYISKPAGYTPTGAAADVFVDRFYHLLAEVINDDEVLNAAILMEFNFITGVVMSIFYGDEASMSFSINFATDSTRAFNYDGTPTDTLRDNVNGPRGMTQYIPFARNQGYYGIRQTNTVQLPHIDIVNIYDGHDNPLTVGGVELENILYAEYLLADDDSLAASNRADLLIRSRNLLVIRSDSGNGNLFRGRLHPSQSVVESFINALSLGAANVYDEIYWDRENGSTGTQVINVHGIDVTFYRYIWVLDFIEGDILSLAGLNDGTFYYGQPHSIHGKPTNAIPGSTSTLISPATVRARITKDEAIITSTTVANTHFAAEWPNSSYAISSARHLNNIRYVPNGSFVQNKDIDMNTLRTITGGDHNFTPIEVFAGTYTATYGAGLQWQIQNLVIDTTTNPWYNNRNVGLFATVSDVHNQGIITGISLAYARITAPNAYYVGSIAGELAGGVINRSNALADVVGRTSTNPAETNFTATGGLIGAITGSTLSNSYNAGFFNTMSSPPHSLVTSHENSYGSVTASGGSIGGLVGENRGTIQRSFNNARVNIASVDIETVSDRHLSTNPNPVPVIGNSYLGGLVGLNTGPLARIQRSYATNFVGATNIATSFTGALVGRNQAGADIQYCSALPTSLLLVGSTDNATASNTEFRTKEQLMDDNSYFIDNGFIQSTNIVEYVSNSPQDYSHLYNIYPYPTLADNAFDYTRPAWSFATALGWEDIFISNVKETTLVYFERYNDIDTGNYGFCANALTNSLSDDANHRVVRAGYMLLLVHDDPGITPEAGLGFYVRSVSPTNIGSWMNITPAVFTDTASYMPDDYVTEYKYAELNLTALEAALPTDSKNDWLEYYISYGVGADNNPTLGGAMVQRGFFHPLFANSVQVLPEEIPLPQEPNEFEVRTPWQMQNIDKLALSGLPEDYEIPGSGGWREVLNLQPSGAMPGDNGTMPGRGIGTSEAANQGVGTSLGLLIGAAQEVAYNPFTHVILPPPSSSSDTYLVSRENLTLHNYTNINTQYLYVEGNLTLTGTIDMRALEGAFITGNLIIDRGAVINSVTNFPNIGATVVVGGDLIINQGATGAAANVNNMRFLVRNNINVLITASNIQLLNGNSIYFTVSSNPTATSGNIWIPTTQMHGNDFIIATQDHWPQFYSIRNIDINFQGGNPRIFGVYAAAADLVFRNNIGNSAPGGGVFISRNNTYGGPARDIPINNMLDPGGFRMPDIPPTPNPVAGEFLYTQTRSMNFGTPLQGGDIGNGTNDGTTPNMDNRIAVVEQPFYSTYTGRGHAALGSTIRNNEILYLTISTSADKTAPHGLFSIIGSEEDSPVTGIVRHVTLRNASITSTALYIPNDSNARVQVGGIAGVNDGFIEDCLVINSNGIYGRNIVGGIAGLNHNNILRSAVQNSTVNGTALGEHVHVGGIVGVNAINPIVAENPFVHDVYFISNNEVDNPPVRFLNTSGTINFGHAGGGIVGSNQVSTPHTIARALYIAPAPFTRTQTGTTDEGAPIYRTDMYPIVGHGYPVLTQTSDTNPMATCFYLSGHQYRLIGNTGTPHFPIPYNLPADNEVIPYGGGIGIVSAFMERERLNFFFNKTPSDPDSDVVHLFPTSIWGQLDEGYPYPYLNSIARPGRWPVTEGALHPIQLDRYPFVNHLPVDEIRAFEQISESTLRARNINFVNGNFDMPLRNPLPPQNTFDIVTQTSPYAPRDNIVSSNEWSRIPGTVPGPLATFPNQNILLDGPRIVPGGTPTVGIGGYWTYINSDWVQGWNVRLAPGIPTAGLPPVGQQGIANAIELQKPYASPGEGGNTLTNYLGTRTGFYAELNAHFPSTLYQILPTSEEREVYYSFHHAANSRDFENGNLMNFYLSGVRYDDINETWRYNTPSTDANPLGTPTLIRPCLTYPRTSTNVTRRAISYGYTEFFNPNINIEGDVSPQHHAFLYDVWVGSSLTAGNGFGITFYIDRETPTTQPIPLSEIAPFGRFDSLEAIPQAYVDNIVGYWDAPLITTPENVTRVSEWKQYYGLYTIPKGQFTTEFAYESPFIPGATTPTHGNFLDGITFESPGFLSVNKTIKRGNTEVKFVQPNDVLTVELAIQNWGEVAVDNIKVTDMFAPYNAYFGYTGGLNVYRTRNTDGSYSNPITLPTGSVEAPSFHNNWTLTIDRISLETPLATDEQIFVVFNITVHEVVHDNVFGTVLNPSAPTPTWYYFFRNQAEVEYFDIDYFGYSYQNVQKRDYNAKENASDMDSVQVFIDSIKLSKTVTPRVQHNVNDTLTVTLTVENATTDSVVTTSGIITDIIPPGFRVLGLPAGASVTGSQTTTQRIIIPNVELNDANRLRTFEYTLRYVGEGFGVIDTSTTADYSFIEGNEMRQLRFPQTYVGIPVRTHDSVFSFTGATSQLFNITNDDLLDEFLNDSNYNIEPSVVLVDGFDNQGNPIYTDLIVTDQYRIELLPTTDLGSTQILFTPTHPEAPPVVRVQYRVLLTATRAGLAQGQELVLDSRISNVTIIPAINNILVYYEMYTGDVYGFRSADIELGLPPLIDDTDVEILEWGYGVINSHATHNVAGAVLAVLGQDNAFTSSVSLGDGDSGAYLHKISGLTTPTIDTYTVTLNATSDLGYFNPSFASTVRTPSLTPTPINTFTIRNAEQRGHLVTLLETGGELSGFTVDSTSHPNSITATGENDDDPPVSITYTFNFQRDMRDGFSYIAPTFAPFAAFFSFGECTCCTCYDDCECEEPERISICEHDCLKEGCPKDCSYVCAEDDCVSLVCILNTNFLCECTACDYICDCDDECFHACYDGDCSIICTCDIHNCETDECELECVHICIEDCIDYCLHHCNDDDCYISCPCALDCDCPHDCFASSFSDIMLAMPLIGYGFTYTNTFKNLKRYLNAKSLRRINQGNRK
ncbi:MAG: prepilin-type N-terminal cleavage/methylation domain-containing protein [Oscillospiraceae bacterium]|nr:prepilin-type N-terminal cleavage/methylation domain-containing protein [Oscillospiraceae bacterium]